MCSAYLKKKNKLLNSTSVYHPPPEPSAELVHGHTTSHADSLPKISKKKKGVISIVTRTGSQ